MAAPASAALGAEAIAARITEALEAQRGPTRREGAELRFRCFNPERHQHGDANPTARWNESKATWYCPVCREGGGALDAAQRLSIEAERQRSVVRETAYLVDDADGHLVAEHVRRDFNDGDKSFEWRRDGEPGLRGLKVADLPLYGLPALLAAPPDATVIVVEGEGSADALRQRGVLAVATYGTGALPSPDVLRPLVGHDVVLWADNDDAGRCYMDEVGARLAALGQPCRELNWSDAPPKGDAADFFADGGTVDVLAALIEAAQPWEPPTAGKVASNGAGGFVLTPLADLLAEPGEAVAWLWDKTLPSGGLSILAAKPKVGKSTLARNLALAVARGEPFLGRGTNKGPVVYLALEEKRGEVAGHFSRMGATDEPIYIHVGGAPQEAMVALEVAIVGTGAKLAIVDPLQRLVRLRDGNDYTEVTAALEPLLLLARRSGCHIVLVHHLGKAERDGGDGILGSTALFGSVDTALMERRRDQARTIESVQRYGEDIPTTVLAWDGASGTVEAAGTVTALEQARAAAAILEALGDGEMTEADLREAVGGNNVVVGHAMRQMVKDGTLERFGEGKKGDPYRYKCSLSRLAMYDKQPSEKSENPPTPSDSPEPPDWVKRSPLVREALRLGAVVESWQDKPADDPWNGGDKHA